MKRRLILITLASLTLIVGITLPKKVNGFKLQQSNIFISNNEGALEKILYDKKPIDNTIIKEITNKIISQKNINLSEIINDIGEAPHYIYYEEYNENSEYIPRIISDKNYINEILNNLYKGKTDKFSIFLNWQKDNDEIFSIIVYGNPKDNNIIDYALDIQNFNIKNFLFEYPNEKDVTAILDTLKNSTKSSMALRDLNVKDISLDSVEKILGPLTFTSSRVGFTINKDVYTERSFACLTEHGLCDYTLMNKEIYISEYILSYTSLPIDRTFVNNPINDMLGKLNINDFSNKYLNARKIFISKNENHTTETFLLRYDDNLLVEATFENDILIEYSYYEISDNFLLYLYGDKLEDSINIDFFA